MNKLTLYDISNEYAEAAEKLADMDLPAQAVMDTLEGLQGEIDRKATNVAMFCQNLETLANQIKEAEAKMAHRRKVLENRAASIKAYIKTCMESAGITKIECPYFKMAIRQNPPRVVIDNMEAIPESSDENTGTTAPGTRQESHRRTSQERFFGDLGASRKRYEARDQMNKRITQAPC
jgi:hypothetical protein